MPLPMPLSIPLLPRKHGSLNHFPELARGIPRESPSELLLKDRFFVSGHIIVSGSGIAKRFKDPALFFLQNFL